MRHAKYFSIFVFLATLGYGAMGFYFLPQASFQGELTRMGLLPESLFGWTKPQPAVDANLMRQSTLQEADVLVIGDSFSDGRVWQTVLTQHGMKVRTESWDGVRGICEDFIPWLRAQGFGGKYLVLESIERNLENDLTRSVACRGTQYHPNPFTDAQRAPPAVSFDVHAGDYSGRFSTGIKTYLNSLEYGQLSRSPEFDTWLLANDAKLVRVKNGCQFFSHAKCNDSLFYAIDKAEDINQSALSNIEILNSRLVGVTPIWVVVPNKSTAYLYPNKQFWNQIKQRYLAPDLLNMTQQAIAKRTVDLYPANGTHFSTTGYLLMGELIFKKIQGTQTDLQSR